MNTSGSRLGSSGSDEASNAASGADGLGALSGSAADPSADMRAQLGTVASGLAEQLTSITEEMNKIRQELYGDSGIGGIAKELEKLKSGGLGGLLDTSALDDLLGGADGLGGGAAESSG